MAWTSPRTWVALEVLTAALLNTHLRDNLLETAPAKVTTQGDLTYATAANALARLAKGTAGQALVMNAGATAPSWGDNGIEAQFQEMLERGVRRQFSMLGPPSNRAAAGVVYTDSLPWGPGWAGYLSGTGATAVPVTATGATQGMWVFTTGATSGNEAGVVGPSVAAARDWTLVGRVIVPSAASQSIFLGAKGVNFGDANDLIAFRVTDTGNVIGVCDSGGTETTRDSGATGATEMTFRIEVRSGGTIVRFFKNNAQIGADVTTNIPTGALTLVAGMRTTAAGTKSMNLIDLASWQEP